MRCIQPQVPRSRKDARATPPLYGVWCRTVYEENVQRALYDCHRVSAMSGTESSLLTVERNRISLQNVLVEYFAETGWNGSAGCETMQITAECA